MYIADNETSKITQLFEEGQESFKRKKLNPYYSKKYHKKSFSTTKDKQPFHDQKILKKKLEISDSSNIKLNLDSMGQK
jgi:hypothetical protein